ncbi:MAG: hypothetical protein SVX38_10600, partial [Chloroflexota bacterium]|nr:hypothetical protein [Chloroflexota bacterium]
SVEPARVVLEGVRRVGFGVLEEGRDVEGCLFPSCLSACLEYMGENYGYSTVEVESETWRENNLYIYLLGTSGAAFQLSWKPGWYMDNPEITHMSDDPAAPFERAFEAVGYGYELIFKEEGRDNVATFRRRIVESIRDQGRPVLGFGVVGPPVCCIITGYDEHGDVLIGWSFFQGFPEFNAGVEFEPSGYFRKRDWFGDTRNSIIIGEKRERSPLSEIYRKALEWALKVVRTPVTFGDRHNGLAAYAAWADHLLLDDDFPADDMDTLRERHMVHNDAVGSLAEGRWYAAHFLRQIAEHESAMAEELLVAAKCYGAEHDLMWEIWNLVGGIGFSDEHVKKLAEPDVRRQMVPIIHRARDKDAEAADHIECALDEMRSRL